MKPPTRITEKLLVQLLIVTLLGGVAWAIPASLFLLSNRDIFGNSITAGTEANGIMELQTTTGTPIPGLTSTTYDFTIDTSNGYTTPNTALDFLAHNIKVSKETQISNVIAQGETEDGRKFKLEFYGSSKTDFRKQGDFDTLTTLLTRLLTGTTQYAHLISKPDPKGVRTLNVTVADNGYDTTPSTLRDNFKHATTITETTIDTNQTLTTITVKQGTTNPETPMSDQPALVTGQFWDNKGETMLNNVPTKMWDFVQTRNLPKTLQNTQILFTVTPDVNKSVLTITLPDNKTVKTETITDSLTKSGLGDRNYPVIIKNSETTLITLYN